MGKRGPKPTPTAVLKLRGSGLVTNRIDRHTQAERPDRPSYLTDEAATMWDELVDLLFSARVLTKRDRNALGRYCLTWDRWREAEEFITENGTTYESATKQGGLIHRQYPQVRQSQQWSQLLARLEAEFGLCPASRAGMGGPKTASNSDSLKSRLKHG